MMKKIFVLLIVALSFILSGCGGTGGDADGNTPPPTAKVSTTVSSFEASGNRFNALINITATRITKSTKIELNNFAVDLLNGCSISNYTFNGSDDINLEFTHDGETHAITVDGEFDCMSRSLLSARDVQIYYDKWITNEDGSKKRGPFHESVNLGHPDNGDGGIQYVLYPDSQLVVESPNTTYHINIGVSIIDENGTHPAINTKINASFLKPIFGSLESYSVTTDNSGTAKFVYTSPNDLQNLSNTHISFYIDGMTSNSAKTDIIFKSPEEKSYTLHPDKELKVKEPDTTYSINVAVSMKDENGEIIPATGQIVKANFIQPEFGTLKSYTVATNESGIAIFNYTSPEDIGNIADTNITFYLEDNTSNTASTKISFIHSNNPNQSYTLHSDKKILVKNPNTIYPINVAVSTVNEDGEDIPAIGKVIKANFIQPEFGTIESYSATTNESGIATFNYTSPKNIENISDTNITFYLEDNTSNTTSTKIDFVNSSGPGQNYNLHPDKEVIVKNPNTSYPINVAVSIINEDGKEIPAIGKVVKANFIQPEFGTIESYSIATDQTGIATFNYTSPKDIKNISNTKITFYLEDNTSNTASTKLSFGVSSQENYLLYPTKDIIVDTPKKEYKIDVTVSVADDNNNTSPAVGVEVKAQFLQPMFGKLQSYSSKTDSSGIATFTYISPENIQDISDTDISFYIGNPMEQPKTTRLHFAPKGEDIATKLYLIPENIQVTTPGEKQTIRVITVNSKNLGKSAVVEFEQLINGDGNDYGSLSQTEITTDANGEGKIEYTAPDILNGQPKRVINVNIKNTDSSEKLTFNFLSSETPPEDGVINYEIDVDTPKTISIEQNSSIAITIHKKGYPDQLIDDENVTSVTLTIEDPSLIKFTQQSDEDDNAYEYEGEASKSVGITTKTVAGVAIIDIKAVVFNGKKDVTIDTTVPLTVMSGPISSISLNYIGSHYDEKNGFFNDIYNVHAVDKYANPANPGEKFHPTLICGGNWNHPQNATTVVQNSKENDATIGKKSIFGEVHTILQDTNQSFTNEQVTPNRDRLIILPSIQASKKDYIGGWSILGITGETEEKSDILILGEEYYEGEEAVKGLMYVVGDEDRLLNDEVHVAHVTAQDGGSDYKIDENGTAQIKVVYDPALVGHTYALSVTSYGENERTGTAIRTNFKGYGDEIYKSKEIEVIVPNGEIVKVDFPIWISLPNGATIPLDQVTLVPESFKLDPIEDCSITGSDSKFKVSHGIVKLNISASSKDQNIDKIKCTVTWVNNHSGIYYEY